MLNLKNIAEKQPDGTQGIATVEVSGSSSEPIIMGGCSIHVSKEDKSHRNILKVEGEENSQVEYFIFVPWFQSSRPEGINDSTRIVIRLPHYKKEEKSIEFSVNGKIFGNYSSVDYLLIPIPQKLTKNNIQFLKRWSSQLLLHHDSKQVLKNTKLFHGFKKEGEKFKYHAFQQGLGELEEQGVLLITTNCNKSECERYVIGCYKKENSSIEKYCFLLRGLDRVNHNQEHPQSPSGSGAADRVNHNQEHPQSQSGSGAADRVNHNQEHPQSQLGIGAADRVDHNQEHPPSQLGSGTADSVNHNQEHPQSQSGSGAADRVNHNQEHPQSQSGSGAADRVNHNQDRLHTASDEEVRDNPLLDQHPSTSTQDSQGNAVFSQECEDGSTSSTSPVVSGWQSSTTGNREDQGHEKLYPPHDQVSEPVSTDRPGGTLPSQQPPVSTDGLGGTLPSQHEPPVCTDGPGNTPPSQQPPLSIDESGGIPPSQQPPVSTDRPGGTLPSQKPPVSIVGLRRTLPSQHELPCGNSDVPPQPPIGQSGPMKHTPEQEGETFTHFLSEFAKKVGVEWKFLGRHLGIPEYTIKAIDDENKTNKEKAFQMFDEWQKKDGKEATPEKLKSVLENKLENKVLAEEVQEWINSVRSAR